MTTEEIYSLLFERECLKDKFAKSEDEIQQLKLKSQASRDAINVELRRFHEQSRQQIKEIDRLREELAHRKENCERTLTNSDEKQKRINKLRAERDCFRDKLIKSENDLAWQKEDREGILERTQEQIDKLRAERDIFRDTRIALLEKCEALQDQLVFEEARTVHTCDEATVCIKELAKKNKQLEKNITVIMYGPEMHSPKDWDSATDLLYVDLKLENEKLKNQAKKLRIRLANCRWYAELSENQASDYLIHDVHWLNFSNIIAEAAISDSTKQATNVKTGEVFFDSPSKEQIDDRSR